MRLFKLFLLFNLLLGWNLANATKRQLDFEFTVNSSGADFWVCKAGLRHPAKGIHGEPGFHGHDPDDASATTGTFTPGNSGWESPTCSDPWNCEIVSGTFKQDYMVVKHCKWDGNEWAPPFDNDCSQMKTEVKLAANSATDTNFAMIGVDPIMSGGVITNANQLRDIRKLTFNLGSDTYGAHYFVKLCFWASEIPHPDDLVSQFKLDANFSKMGNDYSNDAKLGWKLEVTCDDNGDLSDFDQNDTNDFSGGGSVWVGQSFSDGNSPVKMCSVTYSFWEENNNMQRPHRLRSDKFRIWAGVEQNFHWQDVTW